MSISQFLEEKINQVIMISYIPNLIFIIIFSFAIFFFTRNILKLRRVILMGQGIERSDRKSERMKNMIKIALGQSKMVAKPISGILHVVVYIGFIIINIELLEIVLDGLTGRHRLFAPYLGSFYNFLIAMFEVFALLVLIAVFFFWTRRNVLKIKNAGSTELNNNCYPVIGLIDEWNKDGKIIKGTKKDLGGTMRLGLYEAKLKHNSLIKNIYKSSSIKERHRHRYEVNNNLKNKFEEKGMIFSGMSPDNQLPEIIELKNHPWFIGVQFHPEFKSRPLSPHPLFSSFITAAKNHK